MDLQIKIDVFYEQRFEKEEHKHWKYRYSLGSYCSTQWKWTKTFQAS